MTTLPFLYLRSPTLNALAFTPQRNIQLDIFHPHRPVHKFVIAHSSGVRAALRQKLEHRYQEPRDPAGLFRIEMIFLFEDVGQRPVSQSMNVSELAFTVEDFLRPFAR
jgi:hypothetical protein